MSYERLSFECSGCANHIHGAHFTLIRSVEHTVQVDASTVETITSDSQSLAVFCPACGPAPAFALLSHLGIKQVQPEADAPDRPCSKCGLITVAEDEKHVAYIVAEEAIVGGVDLETLDLLSLSPVCASCCPPHESGSTFDVAAVLDLAAAANDPRKEGGAA